ALAQGGLEEFSGNSNLGNTDLIPAVANIINILLGFLGVIAIVIIIIAGFKWMTAAGNEEQISSAKKMLGAGIIGLVIILAAFAIASFVMSNLTTELNAPNI
ncbi:MAG: TrbC/VirB2 family protein, partial [Patescibacteria group bacterium]